MYPSIRVLKTYLVIISSTSEISQHERKLIQILLIIETKNL